MSESELFSHAEFIHGLPAGSEFRGRFDLDPAAEYGLGDVFEVELADGTMIDVGWDEDEPDEPFLITVYREHFGNSSIEFRVKTIEDVLAAVQRLVAEIDGAKGGGADV